MGLAGNGNEKFTFKMGKGLNKMYFKQDFRCYHKR
jgi:hypothetical protein